MEFDFASVGGVEEQNSSFQGEKLINFGYTPPPDIYRQIFSSETPFSGLWDGRTPYSLWQIGKKLFGKFLAAQRQTLGTCTSRGKSLAANLLQFPLIAAGERISFKEVAHAPIYGFGRMVANMLAPPGRDGCYGKAIVEAGEKYGFATLEEIGDNYRSDKLAGEWGWKGVPDNVKQLCKDNLLKKYTLVRTFEDFANFIRAGSAGFICSVRGFSMTRDDEGFCRPQGRWGHCMGVGGITIGKRSGRRGLVLGQSWDQNVPSGPPVEEFPDYCFAVEEDVVNEMLSENDSYVIHAFDYWKELDLPEDYWNPWKN